MQSDKQVARGFFVSCRDGLIVLDGIEESLDEIALGIECKVAGPFDLAGRFWRDDSFDGAHFKAVDEAAGIISCRRERLGCQRFRLRDVVSVVTSETECQGIAKRVDDHVDFYHKAAARTADGLVGRLFYGPRAVGVP